MSRKAGSGRWRSRAWTRAPPLVAAHFQGQPVLVSFRLASTLAKLKKQKNREAELLGGAPSLVAAHFQTSEMSSDL